MYDHTPTFHRTMGESRAFTPACPSATAVKVRAAIPGANAPSSRRNCLNGDAAGIFRPATVKKQAHIKVYTNRKKVMRLDATAGAGLPGLMGGALTQHSSGVRQ